MEPRITLVQFARMSAEIASGLPRADVLSKAGVAVSEWMAAQQAWLGKMADESASARLEITATYRSEFAERKRELAEEKRRTQNEPAGPRTGEGPSRAEPASASQSRATSSPATDAPRDEGAEAQRSALKPPEPPAAARQPVPPPFHRPVAPGHFSPPALIVPSEVAIRALDPPSVQSSFANAQPEELDAYDDLSEPTVDASSFTQGGRSMHGPESTVDSAASVERAALPFQAPLPGQPVRLEEPPRPTKTPEPPGARRGPQTAVVFGSPPARASTLPFANASNPDRPDAGRASGSHHAPPEPRSSQLPPVQSSVESFAALVAALCTAPPERANEVLARANVDPAAYARELHGWLVRFSRDWQLFGRYYQRVQSEMARLSQERGSGRQGP